MKWRIGISLFLFLSYLHAGTLFAQSQEEIDPKVMKEVEALYERKEEVRQFIFELMARKLTQDMIISLEGENFSEEEISKVIDGKSFQNFTARVLSNPITVRHVDRFIENTLHPDRLRKLFLRRKAEIRTAQTTEFVLMLRRLLMERQLRLDEPEEPEPGLARRLWTSIESFFEEKLN